MVASYGLKSVLLGTNYLAGKLQVHSLQVSIRVTSHSRLVRYASQGAHVNVAL